MSGMNGEIIDISSTFTQIAHSVFKKNKKKYEIYPLKTELWDKIKKEEGFQGSDQQEMRIVSLPGGYGFSGSNASFPTARANTAINPKITTKRYYGIAMLDTKSIAESMRDEGSFERVLERSHRDMQRMIQNGSSLALYHTNISNELVLGVIASGGVSGSAGTGWTLTFDTFKPELFHENQCVTIEDGNTDVFYVHSVGTSSIVVKRADSGSQVPAATDEVFLEGGDGNAFTGLKAATASSGTLYNVTIGGQWKSITKDKSGRSLNPDMIFNLCVEVENHCGVMPNFLICSKEQFQKINEYVEARHETRVTSEKGKLGHKKTSLFIKGTELEIMWDRHCDADRVYVLHTDYLKFVKSPMSGIVQDNGSMLQPDYINGTDTYLMVYRLYGELFIEPYAVGLLYNLNTTVE